jgi:hypothetical protein
MDDATPKVRIFLFALSLLSTLLFFTVFVLIGRQVIFSPSDIRGRSDFLKFQIAAQDKGDRDRIVFCTINPGPAREIDLNALRRDCSYDGTEQFVLGSLRMTDQSGRLPLVKEEPEYGWTRYEVLSATPEAQLIETETYYNSDGLVTHYKVAGSFVKPVGQINVTFGLRQIFVVFYLPIALLAAWFASSLLRRLVRRHL